MNTIVRFDHRSFKKGVNDALTLATLITYLTKVSRFAQLIQRDRPVLSAEENDPDFIQASVASN